MEPKTQNTKNNPNIPEQKLEDMKLDSVLMAVHDLREPVTAIRGYTTLLIMESMPKLSKDQQEVLYHLHNTVKNLENLIENLLSASQIEHGKFSLVLSPINIVRVFKDAAEELEDQISSKKLTLKIDDEEGDLPLVLADKNRVAQVALNLLGNAVHYTQDGGNITVSFKNNKNMVEVLVSDTGVGIPADALPKLFTKYYRVSDNRLNSVSGIGLGLFISKSVVNMHGGSIWVESEYGKGSTFHFTLPTDGKSKN